MSKKITNPNYNPNARLVKIVSNHGGYEILRQNPYFNPEGDRPEDPFLAQGWHPRGKRLTLFRAATLISQHREWHVEFQNPDIQDEIQDRIGRLEKDAQQEQPERQIA